MKVYRDPNVSQYASGPAYEDFIDSCQAAEEAEKWAKASESSALNSEESRKAAEWASDQAILNIGIIDKKQTEWNEEQDIIIDKISTANIGNTPLQQPRQVCDGVTKIYASPNETIADPLMFYVQLDGVTQRPTTDFLVTEIGFIDFVDAPPEDSFLDITYFKPNLTGEAYSQINNLFTDQDSTPWKANIKIESSLNLYSNDGLIYLANPDLIPFTTSATWDEDVVLKRFKSEKLVTLQKMRTDSASQIGLVYDRDWFSGIVIANGAMTDKNAIWYNGQFYSVGTDTGFTSTDFDADLTAGNFVEANLTTQVQQWKGVGDVRGWGVFPSTSVDLTDKLNKIFLELRNSSKTVRITDGIYRIDGTVIMESGGCVEFEKNTILKRFKSFSSSTAPVFILRGNHSQSKFGKFVTENASPDGIIKLGHKDKADPNNALWWRCLFPFVEGQQLSGDIGIHIDSSQPTVGTSSANYFGFLENPIIRYADHGIVFSEIANGHTVIAPQFFGMITSALTYYGAYGNSVEGGFLHSSKDGVIGVNLRDKRTGGDHHSRNNMVNGFVVEPGGGSSTALYIDTGCAGNIIKMIGNVAGGVNVKNKNNDYDTWYTSGVSVKWYYGMRLISDDYSLDKERVVSNKKTGLAENSKTTFFRLTPQFKRGAIIEVDILPGNSSLDWNGASRYTFSVVRNSSGVRCDELSKLQPSNYGAAIEAKIVSGNQVDLNAIIPNNGTSTETSVMMRVKLLTDSDMIFDGIVPLGLNDIFAIERL